MSVKATIIVGLEVHVQLATETKLFCGCATAFGASPNTQTCPVCIGAPGALPVLNRKALKLAIKTGLALNCEIEPNTHWDRKNYFYPDLPKGYQISQFDRPICRKGYLDLIDPQSVSSGRRVNIERAHLEEDAGKSSHDETMQGGPTKIDFNRAGTPLLEIVTQPDLRSGHEAKTFLNELKLILSSLKVSDCNMQEGSLRVDANVNLSLATQEGNQATPIVEIKNLNSFRSVERAIEFEAERQLQQWNKDGITIDQAPKQTRGWDDSKGHTVLQRIKEDSADYRYFPDPDLVVIRTTNADIESIQAEIKSLPAERRQILMSRYLLPAYDADVLVNQGDAFVDFFETVADQVKDGKLVSNWLQQELLRHLNATQTDIQACPVNANQFVDFLTHIQTNQLDSSRAKDVFEQMMGDSVSVEQAMKSLGIENLDSEELAAICQRVLDENPKIIAQILKGNTKAIGNLIGKTKSLNKNVSPSQAREQILKMLPKH